MPSIWDNSFPVYLNEKDHEKVDDPWHIEDQENEKGVYLDLKINPEQFTGFEGAYIWTKIYKDNIADDQFYKIISGM